MGIDGIVGIIIADEALALQRLYHWERTAPDRVALTQPMGGGVQRDYTWREVLDQSRRMAAHLHGLGLQRGDRIAIFSKNTGHFERIGFACGRRPPFALVLERCAFDTIDAIVRAGRGESESDRSLGQSVDRLERVRAQAI